MINPSFDELKEVNESRYSLVMTVAKRARRIVDGSSALIESKNRKPVTLAIEEVMDGKISYENTEMD